MKIRINRRNQGILFIIAAGFFFALMTFFVRLSGELPTMQKAMFRNLVALLVTAVMLLKEKQSIYIKRESRFGIFMRCLCGTTGLICNFYAIDKMNISDANMLNKLSPFFAIIMSALILKEMANKVEWGAVILAFIGALFVIKPSFNMQFVYALIGVMGGLGAGIAYTFVRKLGQQGVKGTVIVFYFSLFSVLVTLPFLWKGYVPMTGRQLGILLLAGIAATGGQFCITAAYTRAPAREISVFDYCQVLFAALLGSLFLGQIPDRLSLLGYVIIIGTAIAKWYYNLKMDQAVQIKQKTEK